MNKSKKKIKGQVVSNKMDKTVVVAVHRYVTNPKYDKRYRVTKKYFAHDPGNKCQIGDEVVIQESRPLSRLKRWIVLTK
jgi:small subunit ribosomal protein S17